MLAKRIIPCLDVKDGRVVKGVNFVALRDAGDPVEQARAYDREGADEITFLDIGATHENRDTMYDVVSRTAAEVFIPLTVGGGVRSVEDVRKLLLASMDRDGTKAGFDLDLLRALRGRVRLPLVASGGVGEARHFVEGAQAG